MELLDRTSGNILGSSANGFVADVHSIHFNPCRPSKPPSEGDGREAIFSRIKGTTLLNLHAGFELCEIKKVTAIDREVFDLLRGKNARHCSVFAIQLNRGCLHGDDSRGLADLQRYVTGGYLTYLDYKAVLYGLETCGLHSDHISAGDQGPGAVFTSRGNFRCDFPPGVLRSYGHLCRWNDGTPGIQDGSLNAASANRFLGMSGWHEYHIDADQKRE